jgi:ribonuclease BN (tRNA processing enzyme)
MPCASLICGDGAGKRLQQAFEPPDRRILLLPVRTLFLTHLHAEHTVDYPNLLLDGWYSGLDGVAPPLKVFGPGRRFVPNAAILCLARQPDIRLGTWIFRETQAAVHSSDAT